MDTVDMDVFRFFHWWPTYDDHILSSQLPNVFANGTVTDSTQTAGDPIATFLITVSEFVRNSCKQSVILCALTIFPVRPSHFQALR
jgi:hypothetical protein